MKIKTNNTKTIKCEIIYNANGIIIEREEYKYLDDENNVIGHTKVGYGVYTSDGGLINYCTTKDKAMREASAYERR